MNIEESEIWGILEAVTDPEIPVLSVTDMGIIREVNVKAEDLVEVVITPTYSGCPAMQTIEVNIRAILQEHGFEKVQVRTVLNPAWTTEWLTDSGRQKLKDYGIAPPLESSVDKMALYKHARVVPCPRCHSIQTEMISQFGSTACKSLFRCTECLEPFDYFKCH
jgi:ring-1,2-phenylacetyl-CoA epoxidase subunit PaaD